MECKHTFDYFNGAKCRYCKTYMPEVLVENDPRISEEMNIKLFRRDTPDMAKARLEERQRIIKILEGMIIPLDYDSHIICKVCGSQEADSGCTCQGYNESINDAIAKIKEKP